MRHEAPGSPIWRSTVMVAALGAGAWAAVGLDIANSPEFTSSPSPIEAPCLDLAHNPDDLPGPTQDTTAPNLSQLVSTIHHTDFFSPGPDTDGIEARALKIANKEDEKIRGGAPRGVMPKRWGAKQENEMDAVNRQFQANLEDGYTEFLRSRGITVTDKTPESKLATEIADEGPNQEIVSQLAFIPSQIIQASGLREIVINDDSNAGFKDTIASDIAWDEPEVQNGVLTITDVSEIPSGLSEMILNNCPDKQAILDTMTDINSVSPYQYGSDSEPKDYRRWQDKYGDIFSSTAAMTSPEAEFIELFTNAIQGWNWYDNNPTNTVLGMKQQVVQAVFDRFVPRGQDYETFWNFASGYGNPDNYTPDQLASVLSNLVLQVNKAPTPQAKQAIMQNWDAQF